MELTKKHKQFSLTQYYRGIELNVICVTTSKKKFAELINETVGQVSKYTHTYEPRDKECKEAPDTLFARMGLGGEGRYAFEKDLVLSLTEWKKRIDAHRKKYESYREYLKKTGQE